MCGAVSYSTVCIAGALMDAGTRQRHWQWLTGHQHLAVWAAPAVVSVAVQQTPRMAANRVVYE